MTPEQIQHTIDTRALELSREALTRVEAYERHSDERYRDLKEDIDNHNQNVIAAISRVHDRVDKIFSHGITIGWSVLILLATIIGYLIVNGVPWGIK